MKTSNKLLLVFFLASFFSALSLMLYAKAHVIVNPDGVKDFYYGDGVVVEKTMLDDLTVNNIEMGDNFSYSLDPTRTDVVITGDSAFVSKLKVVTDGQFRILTGGVGRNFDWPDNLHVMVGIKNIDNPKFELSGNARISATEALTYESIEMNLAGNSRSVLDLTADFVDVHTNGNSRVVINGNAKNLKANQNGNSRLNFENCPLGSAELMLNGNAKFYGNNADKVTGHASGNAKIYFDEIAGIQNISTSGNGRFTIRN